MKRPLKLLLLIPHLGGGGAERVAYQLARHLDPDRFEVHLGLIAQDFPGARALPPYVKVHRLDCGRVRSSAWVLLRLLRQLQPDVLMSGMAHLNFLVLLVKPLLIRPLLLKPLLQGRTRVLVRQNTTASAAATTWLTRLAYRTLYPRADRVICQSQAMADDLAESFGIPRDRLAVLANPVDLPTSQPDLDVQPSIWPRDAWPRLLAVGRLSPEKGLDLLLRAMPAIRQRFPGAHAVIFGEGPERGRLVQLCHELALEDSVTLAGHRDDVAQAHSQATLFLQPSRYEGMPNALLEAAAAGLPLVATPSSKGVCELLRNAPGTWLTPAIAADSLAETVVAALSTLPPASEAQRRFRHEFLAAFATPAAIAAYADLFESCAAQERPAHIAMTIPTIDAIGGAERQVLLLAGELARRGYRVTVVALSGALCGALCGGAIATRAELSEAGVAYLALGMRKAWVDPQGWLRYLGWVRRNRPDVVHAHLPHATWFARWVRMLAPVRVQIDTLHTSQTGGRARRFGYRLSGFLSNLITCVSASVADAAVNARLALRQNMRIVPNGVPLPLPETPAYPDASRKYAVAFRWIAVGRLAPVKDYPTLLRAFAMLPGEPQLKIVGSGTEEVALRTLAGQLGIGERVDFAGFCQDVYPLLTRADAFVLASLWEGLPVGVLEASAASLPVVATDGPGTSETILPGETGLLVPVGDSQALADAMASVMEMPESQRRAMGKRGREFMQARYSLTAVADQWEQFYAELLSAHPRLSRWR